MQPVAAGVAAQASGDRQQPVAEPLGSQEPHLVRPGHLSLQADRVTQPLAYPIHAARRLVLAVQAG